MIETEAKREWVTVHQAAPLTGNVDLAYRACPFFRSSASRREEVVRQIEGLAKTDETLAHGMYCLRVQ